jgi:hypothetical protein
MRQERLAGRFTLSDNNQHFTLIRLSDRLSDHAVASIASAAHSLIDLPDLLPGPSSK